MTMQWFIHISCTCTFLEFFLLFKAKGNMYSFQQFQTIPVSRRSCNSLEALQSFVWGAAIYICTAGSLTMCMSWLPACTALLTDCL